MNRAFRTGWQTLELTRELAQANIANSPRLRGKIHDPLAHPTILPGTCPIAPYQPRERGEFQHDGRQVTGASLVHQRCQRHQPSIVLLADQVLFRHAHVLEEHLIKTAVPRHLHERKHGDTGAMHIDHQIADAFMFRRGGIGADE